SSPRRSPPTTSSPSPCATRPAACSARSPWTTCSTARCRPTGEAVKRPDDLSRPSSGRGLSIHYDPDAFGRFSEAIARNLVTARFLVIQTVVVSLWIVINIFAVGLRWDPYPFILLNLAFSTQAAYAAPLILLAQNRQDDRDRAQTAEDREVAARTQA